MKRFCECRQAMVYSIGACIGCEDKPEPTEFELVDDLAEKVGDLVRDAFYEACETMQTWNGVLGPMSQDELFAAWMQSESRKQLVAAFPALDPRDTGYLIERNDIEGRPLWYWEDPYKPGWHSWTLDATTAKRFATREEAEAYEGYQPIAGTDGISITEHVFIPAPPNPRSRI